MPVEPATSGYRYKAGRKVTGDGAYFENLCYICRRLRGKFTVTVTSGQRSDDFRSHAKGNLPVVRYIKIAKNRYFRRTDGEGCPSPVALLTMTLILRHIYIRTGRGVTYSSLSSGKGVWRYLIYKDVEQRSLTSLAYINPTSSLPM